jgi:hypothetical protein
MQYARLYADETGVNASRWAHQGVEKAELSRRFARRQRSTISTRRLALSLIRLEARARCGLRA